MPPSTKPKSHRKPGHAKARFRRQGLRNAAPNSVRSMSPRAKGEAPKPSTNQKMLYLLESFAGAAVTSYIGALAVKYGLSPEIASALLGLGNGAAAISTDREALGHAARGGASVAGSQLVLLAVGPKPNPPAAAPRVVAVQTSTPPPQPQRKNADLGALPPGMLDAAFENARAQLAVSGDGFPSSFQPDHGHLQFHHGTVMP
jgi:hypothetical protein